MTHAATEGKTIQKVDRKLRTPQRVLAIVLIALLTVAGCSGHAASKGGDPGTPHSGGDLVHLVAALKDSWQMQDSNDWYTSQVVVNLVDNLVYLDDHGKAYPWLADSWEVDPTATVFTLHLRHGVTFSDGTPLDARIVADNLNVLGHGDPGKGIVRVPLFPEDYKDAVVVDDSTVKVTLGSPESGFIKTLGYQSAGIVARSTLEASKEKQSRLENLIGSGPFVYESSTPQKEVKLVRRDGYNWPPTSADHKGAAYLHSITFRIVPEDGVRLGALEAGQADSLHYVNPSEEERLQAAGFTVLPGRYIGGTLGIEIRNTAEFVGDIRVRKAIQHAIDRREIIDTLYSKNWLPASSNIQRGVPGWIDLSDAFAFDPNQSNALLDEAGWAAKDSDGVRVKNGKRLVFPMYPTPYLNGSKSELQLIAQQLGRVGIGVELQPTDLSTYDQTTARNDLALFQSHFTLPDVSYLNHFYNSAQMNRFKVVDPKLDDLLARVSTTLDGPEKDAIAAELQRYIIEQAYFIPIEEGGQVFVIAADVHDLHINGTGRPYFYDTWLSR